MINIYFRDAMWTLYHWFCKTRNSDLQEVFLNPMVSGTINNTSVGNMKFELEGNMPGIYKQCESKAVGRNEYV